MLSSMDGVGAMLGAIALVLLAQPARYPAIFVGGVILFQAMQIAFALAADPKLAGLLLMVADFSHTCFVVMQATMIYREVTPQMRTRMLGLLSVCIGVGPIGFVQVGFLGRRLASARQSSPRHLRGSWRWGWRYRYGGTSDRGRVSERSRNRRNLS